MTSEICLHARTRTHTHARAHAHTERDRHTYTQRETERESESERKRERERERAIKLISWTFKSLFSSKTNSTTKATWETHQGSPSDCRDWSRRADFILNGRSQMILPHFSQRSVLNFLPVLSSLKSAKRQSPFPGCPEMFVFFSPKTKTPLYKDRFRSIQ